MIYLVLNAKNDNNEPNTYWNVTYPRTFSGNYGLLSTFRANEVILSSWSDVRMVLRPNTSVSNNSETHLGYVFLFGIC